MLEKAINQLEIELNKLPEPSAKDLIKEKKSPRKEKKKRDDLNNQKDDVIEDIDVTYDVKENNSLNVHKEIDIND